MRVIYVYCLPLWLLFFSPANLIAVIPPVSQPPAQATTLFYNGKVRLMDDSQNAVDWFAVSDGNVVGYGRGSTYRLFSATEKVDLKGRLVMPGLIDGHLHLNSLGNRPNQVNLSGARSAENAVKRIRSYLAGFPAAPPVVQGRGWDQSLWGGKYPSRQLLDDIYADKPIILYRVDGHAAWVNTAALKQSGLWDQKTEIPGGEILKDASGNPTGILIDEAMSKLDSITPKPSPEALEKNILRSVHLLHSLGIVGAHDAGATEEEVAAIRRLLKSGKARFRFYEMISADREANWEEWVKRGPEIASENGFLTVRTVKIMADGAMGSRGAAFDKPYSDEPTQKGLMRETPQSLEKKIRFIHKNGFQVAIHGIGTRANRVIIDTLLKVMGSKTHRARPRIEHAQVLHESDIARIAKSGIIASMQPLHCSDDLKWVVDRIGKERARFAYPWKSLLEAGAKLGFGSDAPVVSASPWLGMFAALTRMPLRNRTHVPAFNPQESLNLLQTYRAYTGGNAFSAFEENISGELTHGRRADFVVLSKDPFEANPSDFLNWTVDETYVGGKKVWPAQNLP